MRKLFPLLFLIAGAWPLRSQVEVRGELDTTYIMIGDQVRLTLRIAQAPSARIIRIDWGALRQAPALEVIQEGALDTVAARGEVLLTQTVTFTSFDSGYHRVPPIPVYYLIDGRADSTRSAELALRVITFPIAADTANLAPIKPIIEEPLHLEDVLPYLLLGIGLPLLITLVVVLLRGRRRRPEPPPAPPRPPGEVARERLAALRAAQLWQRGQIKAFQSELTHIVREYLENRFHIPALESTSEEIIGRLAAAGLDGDWRDRLREMLQTADLVKFARATPPLAIHEEMLTRAEQFVEATPPGDNPGEEDDHDEITAAPEPK